MGYTAALVLGARAWTPPVGGDMGSIACFLRDGDRVFLTYSTTGRGNEPAAALFGLLDMTPYGRGEAWEDDPGGLARGPPLTQFFSADADLVPSFLRPRPAAQWRGEHNCPSRLIDRP